MCIYIYMYTYTYRERERDRDITTNNVISLSLQVLVPTSLLPPAVSFHLASV